MATDPRPMRLSTIVAPLKDRVDRPGGLFRVYYTLRDASEGRPDAPMGVCDQEIVLRYVHALELTAREFHDWSWGEPHRWDEHGGRVPVFVFDTTRYVRADAPFTQSDSLGRSLVGLRSVIREPRLEVMCERADVEAVHEASHVFTHFYRRPEGRLQPNGKIADPWYWLDEATAVYMEGRIFRGHKESMRFALNFVYRPDLSLVDDGEGSGYSSAWFVRHLVDRHGPKILHDVWKQAGPLEADPVAIIDGELKRHGSSFDREFSEYCLRGANMCEFDFDVFARHGNRLATESFRLSGVGSPCRSSGLDWLDPLACRYYRIGWDGGVVGSIRAIVRTEPAAVKEINATLIPMHNHGFAGESLSLMPRAEESSLSGVMDLKGGETHAILVVNRGTAVTAGAVSFQIEISAS
jgi:hypothetical protein